MKPLKKFNTTINESKEGFSLNRLANNQLGMEPASDFLTKYNVDMKALTKAKQQKVINSFEIRDVVNGKADKKLKDKFFELFVTENSLTEEDNKLEKIRHFKGSVKDFKSFFDEKAGKNTNAFDTPEYQGFNKVHPTRGENESPHWKDVQESNDYGPGLLVNPRTRSDIQKIDNLIDDLDLQAEWDHKEGFFWFPEEEDSYDALEAIIQKELDKRNINAHIEGVWESHKKREELNRIPLFEDFKYE